MFVYIGFHFVHIINVGSFICYLEHFGTDDSIIYEFDYADGTDVYDLPHPVTDSDVYYTNLTAAITPLVNTCNCMVSEPLPRR